MPTKSEVKSEKKAERVEEVKEKDDISRKRKRISEIEAEISLKRGTIGDVLAGGSQARNRHSVVTKELEPVIAELTGLYTELGIPLVRISEL